jgi:rhomboid protease GluP
LRLIAQAAPQSWFPKIFAKERQIDLGQIYLLLELLQLDGLIERGASDPTAGPGVVLTPAGKSLLNDPAKLARLRSGQPLVPGDQGGEVRRVLMVPPQGPWARVLLWANILVFVYACYLAWPHKGLVQAYLTAGVGVGQPAAIHRLLIQVGGLDTNEFMDGEYWRLITANFVHLGLLHILMNMWMMSGSARITESMWGGWRFLLIYFIAALGTTSFSLAVGGVGGVGASGALCGILAAEAMWFWLNRRFLPRSAYRRFVGVFILNVVLLTLISLMPGVGGWGHLGGVIFGALAAFLLHFQRYGPKPLRAPALVSTLLLPLLATVALAYAPDYNPRWIPAEDRYYRERDKEAGPANQYLPALDIQYEAEWWPLLQQNPGRRKAEEVAAVIQAIDAASTKLTNLESSFSGMSRFRSPHITAYREATVALIRAWQAYLAEVKRCLEAGKDWPRRDDAKLEKLYAVLEAADTEWKKRRNYWGDWRNWNT